MFNNTFCRRLMQTYALLALLLSAAVSSPVQAQAPRFKVIAFYNGNFDKAHISFVREANKWFPAIAAQYNFSYEATNNWNNLNANFLSQYQVVLFLDDAPTGAAQRQAFQTYMQNGGAWMGFHVSAFTQNASEWSWYHNTFLGKGNFVRNTWFPTSAILRCEDNTHPSTQRLTTTFTSCVSEWYAWSNDLRTNPNIRILCSVDPASFPLGTDPNQTFYSGYYPIIWTNRNYKMLYANFGHNDVSYNPDADKSSTFASEIQNRFIIDGLLWLGGVTPGPAPAIPVPGTVQAEHYTAMNNVQTEVTTDAGGGLNVGYIDANDWMDYKLNVQTAGEYNIQYRIASQNGGGSIQLRKDTAILATTAIPATGGWQNWTTVTATATLAAGEQTLRLFMPAGGFNVNWIQFSATSNPTNVPIGKVITLKGNNGMFVSSENGAQPMNCNRPAAQGWEQFTVLDGGAGKIVLQAMNKYVSSEGGTKAMNCNRTVIGSYEKFDWIQNPDGTISLRGNNGQYVSSENGAQPMNCNRPTIEGWEKFTFAEVSSGARTMQIVPEEKTADAATGTAYPNPFGNQLFYTLPAKYTFHTVVVYDLNGRQHIRAVVKTQQSTYTLDASRLPKGFYILDITSGNYHKRIKVQKAE
ncbi:carbohydrate-binding protein [uncultured Chitinophaga sp.]|jgi:Trehalose utilisation./Carbohydrate binding module (family 6).|uniref:carbohydrate-binding protein n=1 Tax=uncultured Chitinophaga sp. TaxID=339340 RepID=UPI00261A609C|nr:carbohydrate-binding protein [uncultured Chitinophaga sp.]